VELGSAGQVKSVARAYDVTLRALRRALSDAGLNVVQQFDLSNGWPSQLVAGSRRCALLMVDCPLLLLEAVALDRSAAAFMPLHIVVTGDQHSSCIHWAHPAESIGLRPSRTAKGPVDALYTRVTQVLEGDDS
jgi:uncharacterized protein (DUF302 family)